MRNSSVFLMAWAVAFVAANLAWADVALRIDDISVTRPGVGTSAFTLDVFVDVTAPSSINLSTYNVPVDFVDEGIGVTLLPTAQSTAPFTGDPVEVVGPAPGVDLGVADNEASFLDIPLGPGTSLKLFSLMFEIDAGAPDQVYNVDLVDSGSPFMQLADSAGTPITIDRLDNGTITVPEPATALTALAVCGLLALRRRGRR